MTDDEELKIKRLFTAYDKNHDGWISRGEWYDVVHKFLGDKDAAWILAEVQRTCRGEAPGASRVWAGRVGGLGVGVGASYHNRTFHIRWIP